MKVASDLGGVDGYGPVVPEVDEPVFHAPWEGRVLALTLAMGATKAWTVDASRFAREDRPRAEYLRMSYYELWLTALERLIITHGLADRDEIASGQIAAEPAPIKARLTASDVTSVLRRGAPADRPADDPARFSVGERVRTRDEDPPGHTRLPTYARGKVGIVTRVHGCHVLPDTNAHQLGEQPQWLYNVDFSSHDLFGPDSDPRSRISVDAFEPYLEAT